MFEVNAVTITLAIIIGWLILDALIQRKRAKKLETLRDNLKDLDTWVNGYEYSCGSRDDAIGDYEWKHPLYKDTRFGVLSMTARGKQHTDQITCLNATVDMLLKHNNLEITETQAKEAGVKLSKMKPVTAALKKKGKK